MSIRIIAQLNPFSTERTFKDLDKKKIKLKKVLKQLELDEKEQSFTVSVDGEPITDWNYKVHEDQLVLIKVLPTDMDGGDWLRVGSGAFGVAMITMGILSFPLTLGISAPLAGLLIAGGLGMTAGAIWGPQIIGSFFDFDSTSTGGAPGASTPSYLKGGENTLGQNKNIPIVLGKHRTYPYQVAWPYVNLITRGHESLEIIGTRYEYTTNATYFSQEMSQLFLWGHKEVSPIPSSYKRGETLISNLTDSLVSTDPDEYYGSEGVKFINVGQTLKAFNTGRRIYYPENIYLPSGLNQLELTFIFSSFYLMTDRGTALTPETSIFYLLFDKTANESLIPRDAVRFGRINIKGPKVGSGDTQEVLAVNHTIDYDLDPEHAYVLQIERGDDSQEIESRVQGINVQLSYITSKTSKEVMIPEAKNLFSFSSLQITDATRTTQLSGDLADFNAIVQTTIPVYTGPNEVPLDIDDSYWSYSAITSNPASLYLYVLQGSINKRPVNSNEIDWEALTEWYLFCEEEGFQCNSVIMEPGSVSSILAMIASTGRAAPYNNEKYSIIIDRERDAPTQLITNKNSWGLSLQRDLDEEVHAIKYTFIDGTEEGDYQPSYLWVYRTGYDETNAKLKRIVEMPGITDPLLVSKLGKYRMNCIERRIETITVSMDIEYLLAQQGDLVSLAYEELLIGLGNGRITQVNRNSSNEITSLILDEFVTLEANEHYGIQTRNENGDMLSTIPLAISTTEEYTREVTLETPFNYNLNVNDLYAFGTYTNALDDKTSGLYVVLNVTPGKDLSATLTLMDYAPEVYDTSAMPPYESNFSLPGNFGVSPILADPFDVKDIALQSTKEINKIKSMVDPSLKYAIKSSQPPAGYLRDDAFELVLSNTYLYFTDRETHKLYQVNPLVNSSRALMIDEAITTFDVYNDDLFLYSTGGILKLFTLSTGVTINVNSVLTAQPKFISENDFIYINYSDMNKVYKSTIVDDDNGSIFIDYSTTSISATGLKTVWNEAGTSNVYVKMNDNIDITDKGGLIKETLTTNLIAIPPALWPNEDIEIGLIYIDASTQTAYINDVPYYANVYKHTMNENGDYAFLTYDFKVYYLSLINDNLQARLDVEIENYGESISCSLNYLDTKVTNISADDISHFAFNDDLTGAGIPDDTKVSFVGHNYIIMSKTASITEASATINVSGSRLLLDANKVVVTGSISARLLETNAINSMDYVTNESSPNYEKKLYSHNLATGEISQYNPEGKLLSHFDSTNGLYLADGITIGGEEVPENPSFTDTTYQVYVQGSAPTGMSENDQWFNTSTKNLFVYQSGIWKDLGPTTLAELDNDQNEKLTGIEDNATNTQAYHVTTLTQLNAIVGSSGDIGYVSTGDDVYSWNSGWVKVADSTKEYLENGGNISYYNSVTEASYSFIDGVLTAKKAIIYGDIYAENGYFKGDLDGANITGANGTFSGDLIVTSDDHNRKIELGSKGLKVTDNSNRIVHDLPASGASNLIYVGHQYRDTSLKGLVINTTGSSCTINTSQANTSLYLEVRVYFDGYMNANSFRIINFKYWGDTQQEFRIPFSTANFSATSATFYMQLDATIAESATFNCFENRVIENGSIDFKTWTIDSMEVTILEAITTR